MNFLAQSSTFKLAGLVGVIVGVIGVTIPSLLYRGTEGEKYSFLNHYISELGETGVSRLSWMFNLAMILAGLGIMLASLSLGMILPGFWAKAGLLLGVIAGFALSMVGAFPMNQIKLHSIAAIAFFRAGLLMVLFFSLAIGSQSGQDPLVSRWLGLVGLIPVLAFAVFLGLMWSVHKQDQEALDTAGLERPRVWKFAVAEWSIFFSMIIWILVLALAL